MRVDGAAGNRAWQIPIATSYDAVPFNYRNAGLTCVSMTWRATFACDPARCSTLTPAEHRLRYPYYFLSATLSWEPGKTVGSFLLTLGAIPFAFAIVARKLGGEVQFKGLKPVLTAPVFRTITNYVARLSSSAFHLNLRPYDLSWTCGARSCRGRRRPSGRCRACAASTGGRRRRRSRCTR
jgi:hypothetical protein